MGRAARLVVGAALVWMTYDVVRSEDMAFNVRVTGVFLLTTGFYAALHLLVMRLAQGVNAWLGAVLAVTPAVLVYALGGPVGRVASVAYIGVSLVVQAIRRDGGCEVMSIPGIMFGQRTHLVCLAFSPLDWVEHRMARRHTP